MLNTGKTAKARQMAVSGIAVAWRDRLRRLAVCGLTVAALASAGCSGFGEKFTAWNQSVKKKIVPPDPMVVLRDSTNGDDRADALRRLKEPARNGGSETDQEAILSILTTAATRDSKPLCRLAAISKLGEFKDPRASQALIAAHDAAPRSFAAETATIIQCQALTALGEVGNSEGLDLLVLVAKEPPPAPEVSEAEKQLARDRKLAAVRSLSHFNNAQATEALVRVLQNERDVALRDRAHESLQVATGKKLPPDAKAWEEALHPADRKAPGEVLTGHQKKL